MDAQVFQVIITVVGAVVGGLISLVLYGVGTQIKAMNSKTESVVTSLGKVDTSLAILINNNKHIEEKVKKNQRCIEKLEDENIKLSTRIDDTVNKLTNMNFRLSTKCDKLKNQDLIGDIQVGL